MAPERQSCPGCGAFMPLRYDNHRTLVTLAGAVRLRLKIRRCEREACACYRRPYRPEAEGAVALPQHEFGLDVVALVGALRHRDHPCRKSTPCCASAGSTSPSARCATCSTATTNCW